MYYTYVLHSRKDNNFYVRYTKDLKQRFEEHEKGFVESLGVVFPAACGVKRMYERVHT